MYDESEQLQCDVARIDSRVLRHMVMETVDLLELSSDHADEACESTDAAMALTRIDWMLMAVFNWLTRQLRTEDAQDGELTLGKPVSVIGIDFEAISPGLQSFASTVDRLHARASQLESLITATASIQVKTPSISVSGGAKVLHIFGDPNPSTAVENPVLMSRRRLNSAFGGN